MLILALIAALAALALAVYWRHRRSVQRREALFVFATSRGWSFRVAEDALAQQWVGTPFGEGDRRKVTNVVRGTVDGHPLTAFDYQYETTSSSSSSGSGQQGSTQRFSVVVLGMPAYLPTVEVTPESLVDRVGSAVGVARDLELESEDFNRRYRISAYDPKFASDVLTPRTMELLLGRPSLAFRIQGTDIVSWQPGSLAPLEIVVRAGTLGAVLDGIPAYIWRDHGASA